MPSVTGEGDDMFCLLISKLPAAMCFFQRTVPWERPTHHSQRSCLSATFKKILSPQIIGVAPLLVGRGSFHATFSSRVQRTGRLVSWLTPSRLGPRHCGQFSPRTDGIDRAKQMTAMT